MIGYATLGTNHPARSQAFYDALPVDLLEIELPKSREIEAPAARGDPRRWQYLHFAGPSSLVTS